MWGTSMNLDAVYTTGVLKYGNDIVFILRSNAIAVVEGERYGDWLKS
jgi:hypothetical protein